MLAMLHVINRTSKGACESGSPDRQRDTSVLAHMTGARVAAALGVDPVSGLIASEVSRRAAEYGPNRLADKRPRPVWIRFFDQFKNLLILVLVVAAAGRGLDRVQ